MSAEFVIPDWMVPADPPPQPDLSEVDPHRIEGLVNRFIAAKQDALFEAPDAYYRTTGADAVDGTPAILDRLTGLRDAMVDQARDDDERALLGPRLALHIADATDGIDRHVANQQDELARQIISERQRLIQRAAELEHTNDDKLAGLAEANASAAQELARMNGEPEGPAIDAARSAIWHSAIGQRIANGDGAGAIELFQRGRHQLTAQHVLSLDTPLQVARQDQTADQWIANQSATDGPPLKERLDADPDLPQETKYVIRAKVDARDSAEESKQVATIQALDDQARAAMRAQAINPGAYKPGTFARLADAYEAAGDPERANGARREAARESFLLPFAQASAEKQQRMIDELPPGELRDIAEALRNHQASTFAHDAFAAGTSIYKEVGPPVPIDDIQGRVLQARQIATLRGGAPVVPLTADEIEHMQRAYATGSEQERQAISALLDAVPEDMHPTAEPVSIYPEIASYPPARSSGAGTTPSLASISDQASGEGDAVTSDTPTATRREVQSEPEAGNGRVTPMDPNIIFAADTPRPPGLAEPDERLVDDRQIAQTTPASRKDAPNREAPKNPASTPSAQKKPAVATQPAPSSTTRTKPGDRPPRTPEEVIPAMEARAEEWAGIVGAQPVITERGQQLLPDDWEKAIDKINPNYSKWTKEAAQRYGIPPLLLARMFFKETGYNANSENSATGARGIAQLLPDALRSIKVNPGTFNYFDAKASIEAGAAYLAWNNNWYKDWAKSVAAYNWGIGQMERWAAGVPMIYSEKKRAWIEAPPLPNETKTTISHVFRGDPKAFDER
jgi:hypothetical protein